MNYCTSNDDQMILKNNLEIKELILIMTQNFVLQMSNNKRFISLIRMEITQRSKAFYQKLILSNDPVDQCVYKD